AAGSCCAARTGRGAPERSLVKVGAFASAGNAVIAKASPATRPVSTFPRIVRNRMVWPFTENAFSWSGTILTIEHDADDRTLWNASRRQTDASERVTSNE